MKNVTDDVKSLKGDDDMTAEKMNRLSECISTLRDMPYEKLIRINNKYALDGFGYMVYENLKPEIDNVFEYPSEAVEAICKGKYSYTDGFFYIGDDGAVYSFNDVYEDSPINLTKLAQVIIEKGGE